MPALYRVNAFAGFPEALEADEALSLVASFIIPGPL